MCILSTRKFGTSEAVAFSAALSDNTSLAELLASGHPLEVAGATAFGEALSRNTTLRSLCVGDKNFGDKVCRSACGGRGEGEMWATEVAAKYPRNTLHLCFSEILSVNDVGLSFAH